MPDAHVDMIRFWAGYWRKNRGILLDGALAPHGPDALYPEVRASSRQKSIIALYAPRVIDLVDEAARDVHVVNATAYGTVVLRVGEGMGERRVRILDTTGRVIRVATQVLAPGLHERAVPPSGLLEFSRVEPPLGDAVRAGP